MEVTTSGPAKELWITLGIRFGGEEKEMKPYSNKAACFSGQIPTGFLERCGGFGV